MRTADDGLEARVPVRAGMRQVVATFVKSEGVVPEGPGPDRIPIWSHNYDGDYREQAIISELRIGGPYDGRVEDSPSRQRIFTCHPTAAEEEASCASTILSTLARRAYRRPVTDQDVQTLLGFYETGAAEGGFDEGIRLALERILISPDFLFRMERDPADIEPGTAYRLSDIELASRLSFFLWNSIPDDELLGLAEEGRLEDPAVMEQQVRRMLADPRARDALVDNFFGQWLQIRNVWLLTPDANRNFPWFDDNLRSAFVTEMELFSRQPAQGGPQRRRSADRERNVPQRTTGQALRCTRRVRQPLPARDAHERESLWLTWQGGDPGRDLVPQPNRSDYPRKVAAREHSGRRRRRRRLAMWT